MNSAMVQMLSSFKRATMLVVVAWLSVSVPLGPMGLGDAAALGEAGDCGSSCPCDQENEHHTEGDHCDGEGSTLAGCQDAHEQCPGHAGTPDSKQCPADCPNCSCCIGAVVALAPPAPPVSTLPTGLEQRPAALNAPPPGEASRVFRPPRSAA